MSAGVHHACGVTTGGDAYCWGTNSHGQLGTGDNVPSEVPVEVTDPSGGSVTWASITAGGLHTCSVTNTGVGYCWGRADAGALGNGSTTITNVPTLISDPF